MSKRRRWQKRRRCVEQSLACQCISSRNSQKRVQFRLIVFAATVQQAQGRSEGQAPEASLHQGQYADIDTIPRNPAAPPSTAMSASSVHMFGASHRTSANEVNENMNVNTNAERIDVRSMATKIVSNGSLAMADGKHTNASSYREGVSISLVRQIE